MNITNRILADARWSGAHGIGRFSHEIISRLKNTDILSNGPAPLSIKNLYWLPQQLSKLKNQYHVYFSPGFMPPINSRMPFVFTIHDLIHIHGPSNKKIIYQLIYNTIIKSATKRASKIITVSEYSKNEIISWSNIPNEKIAVIYNGISNVFSPEGKKYQSGYPYLFYVGNTKPHKNVPRILHAFANAKIDSGIKLILATQATEELNALIKKNHSADRVIFTSNLSEDQLAQHYRGAIGLLFPTLHEGFGLPVVEAMASGTPVITSNVTSLPEVVGNAAIMINPLDIESLIFNIEQIVTNDALRQNLIAKGLIQAKKFSWDRSAQRLQHILNEI